MKKEQEIIKYKSYGYKLNEKTAKLFKELKVINGKSWNLFFYEIIREHANANKHLYREHFALIYRKFIKENCELCGKEDEYKKGRRLCVHHIDGDITNNKKDNLQTLCSSCHGKQYPR